MKNEKSNLTIRFDKAEREEFENICNSLGINVSTAIHIFVKAVIREQKIPFTISLHHN